MSTKRREFLMASIGAGLGAQALPAKAGSLTTVSKLPAIPPEPDFYSGEAFCEFRDEFSRCRSQVPQLVAIAYAEAHPSMKLLVVAAIRAGAHEIIDQTTELLSCSRVHSDWSPRFATTGDAVPEYACLIRWAAAISLGFMGPAGTKALPQLRTRLQAEHNEDVLAAIEWAIAEIGGAR